MSTLDPYLKRKAGILEQQRQQLADNPDNGIALLRASSYVAGITGIRPVKMGEYTVNTDSGPALAGHGLGPSSPELLLGALASCLAHTYVLQASLHSISLDHVGIEVTGELNLADAVNPDNTSTISIDNLSYRADVKSSADAKVLTRLHELVERACAVLNTIRIAQQVTRKG